MKVAAPDGELAAEVISRGDAGQHVDGPQGIVREDAPEVLELSRAEHLGRRDRHRRRAKDVRRHRDALRVGAGPLDERHDEIYGRARLEGHVPLLHGVTDHGDVQPVGAYAQAVQHEPSVPVRQDRTAGVLDDDQHSLQPAVRPGIDDASAQSGGRLAGVECNAEQQKNQRKSHTEELYTKL